MDSIPQKGAFCATQNTDNVPVELRVRIGISRKPVKRQSPNGVHWKIEHRTVTLSELIELVQCGHALGAICGGQHSYETFIGRQDIQLDIDTDLKSPLHYYLGHSFFKQYGFLAYTTNTPGHCRLFFRLSKQITNPVQYAKYAQALAHLFGADLAATSPAQLWFTYAGCDVAIVGNTLPLEVVEDLARQMFDSDDYAPPPPSADPDTLLQLAIDAGQPGNRHHAGVDLAMQLRRLNLPFEQAEKYLRRYQSTVAFRGDIEPYSASEALATLRGVYRHRKHIDTGIIEQARQAAMDGVIKVEVRRTDRKTGETVTKQEPMPVNVRRTFFAILEAMEEIGRTTNVTLSIRQICRAASWHIGKYTVSQHIAVLKGAGLLRSYPGDSGKPSVYSLTYHPEVRGGYRDLGTLQEGDEGEGNILGNPSPSCSVPRSRLVTTFRELQHSAAAEPGAKIHPQLATSEEDYLVRLGSSAQAVIAALEAAENSTVDSVASLQALSGLSWRCTATAVKSLVEIGVVETISVKTETGKAKNVRLLPMWREKLRDAEPMLTTYGRDILRAGQYLDQRQAWHERHADYAKKDEQRAQHDALAERASDEKLVNDIQHAAAMDARKEAAQRLGLSPEAAPPISLSNGRKQQKQRQPVVEHKNGKFITRPIIPDESNITEKSNRRTQREKLSASGVEVKTVQRLTLGSIHDDAFGTVETVTVATPKEQRLERFVLAPQQEAQELWL